MSPINRLTLLASLMLVSLATYAHHSFSGTYQANKKISITGVVSEFRFFNPHVLAYVTVTNANGTKTQWISEGPAANQHRRAGWSKDSLKKGDLVRISGDSTRDGSPMIAMDKIEVLNPKDQSVARVLAKPQGATTLPDGPTKVASLALRLADGRPNFSGPWTQGSFTRYPVVPLNDAGKALQASYQSENDPQIFCDPPGLVRQAGFTPHPIRITQLKDRVIIEYEEYGGRREIFLAPHKIKSKGKSNLGDSIARYEGDALIIESTNLLGNWTTPEANRLSDKTTTVETYRRFDDPKNGPSLSVQMVVTDPVYLAEPWTLKTTKTYYEGYEFIKNDCRPPLRKRTDK
jgi:hypothetical protein